jgi:hypothetical protein
MLWFQLLHKGVLHASKRTDNLFCLHQIGLWADLAIKVHFFEHHFVFALQASGRETRLFRESLSEKNST